MMEEVTEKLSAEELTVRERLEPDELERVLAELKLDPAQAETWAILERVSVWL
jgi:hypothetical protein